MQWRDRVAGYGWISITLHWLAAAALSALLIIGASIGSTSPMLDRAVYWHTSIAVLFYLPLWLRLVWRWRVGHPSPSPRQRGVSFAFGRCVHWAMLVCVAGLLLSGPVLAWARGVPIRVFNWAVVPSPITPQSAVAEIAWGIHSLLAMLFACLIGLHILGVFKHVIFNKDETLARMLAVREPAFPLTRGSIDDPRPRSN